MRAMVAVEQPDGSVDVLVLDSAWVSIRRDSLDWWEATRPLYRVQNRGFRTTVEVSGFGETVHHRARPEWFPAPAPALPAAQPEIEAP